MEKNGLFLSLTSILFISSCLPSSNFSNDISKSQSDNEAGQDSVTISVPLDQDAALGSNTASPKNAPNTVSVGPTPIIPALGEVPDDTHPVNKLEENIVQKAYELILSREADVGGLSTWSEYLKANSTSELLVHLILSSEFLNNHPQFQADKRAAIQILYTILLGRIPQGSEIEFWYNTKHYFDDLIREFVASQEFREKRPEFVRERNLCRFGLNNASVDSGPAISACINLSEKFALFPAGTFYLQSNLKLNKKRNSQLILSTAGFEMLEDDSSAPACLSTDNDVRCAIFKATHDNGDGPLLYSGDFSNLELKYIGFDGNINGRRSHFGTDYWNQNFGLTSKRNNQANIVLYCEQCRFLGIGSVRAVAAAGFIFIGKNGKFISSVFRDNGNGLNRTNKFGEWADGLTVVNGENLVVKNSTFWNNSDINLIIGNTPNGLITDNKIGANNDSSANFAFGGLMLHNFANPSNSFYGAIIENNLIDCGELHSCGIGLDIGPYMWYTNEGVGKPLWPVGGGTVQNNIILRSRQGIGIYGAHDTTIRGNTVFSCGGFRLPDGRYTSLIDVTLGPSQRINLDPNGLVPTYDRLIPNLNYDLNPDPNELNNLFYSIHGV